MKKENVRIILGSLLGGPIGTGIAMIINEKRKSRAFTDEELKEMGINVIEVKTVDVKTVEI